MKPLRLTTLALLAGSMLSPLGVAAQDPAPAVPAGPLLGPFASQRVMLLPVQFWRADSVGWSRSVVWAQTRLAIDSAVQAVLQERGLGRKWAYPSDVVRSARRNPTYSSDPYALGAGRWRTVVPKAEEEIASALADNLRPLTALGDTRFALIPVDLHADGESVILRLVMADTRSRRVVWAGDLRAPGGTGMIAGLATRLADLVIEP